MKKQQIILLHIIFWLLFGLFPELPVIFPDKKYPLWVFYYDGATVFLHIINFYLCYTFISFNFFSKNRQRSSWLLLSLFVIVFTFVRILFIRDVVYLHILGMEELPRLRLYNLVMEIVNTLLFTALPISLKFIVDWFKTQKLKSELINQNKTSELALLRSQINPHFLFNTLNNLYSLVNKKSDEAPNVVMKLSDIMRYMLNEASSDRVPLEKEIQYLESYIQLQQLRLKTDKFIVFRVVGDTKGYYIPPMLLIPFVENAIKHGKKNVKPPGIEISLELKGKGFIFEVSNHCHQPESVQKDPNQGIGLSNVKRRLELLFPEKHTLILQPCGAKYQVHLEIDEL